MSGVAGVHTLVTGLNGHGKTLYTVAQKLKPLVGTTALLEQPDGTKVAVERRLVIGGIRDLLLPHELMEVPKLDPESWRDEWATEKREPGDPPRGDVIVSAVNWWLWCMPGDVIVIDECQRLFRPMASGRRVPTFIEKLETARHYGVQFVYITQHPQLLHSNVRSLVGPHEHVRRIFGTSSTTIYQWDHCTHPDKIKSATKSTWRHSRAAFGLYKSAELHTKFRQKLPIQVYMVGLAVIGVAYGVWSIVGRVGDKFNPKPQQAALANAKPISGAVPSPASKTRSAGATDAAAGRWPVYDTSTVVAPDPLEGRAVQWEGEYRHGDVRVVYFGLLVDGARVATVTLAQLVSMGYTVTEFGPCSLVLRHGERVRSVTCTKAPPLDQRLLKHDDPSNTAL